MRKFLVGSLFTIMSITAVNAQTAEPEEVIVPLGEICAKEAEKKPVLLPDPNCAPQGSVTNLASNMNTILPKLGTSMDSCSKITQYHKIVGEEPLSIEVEDQNKKKWKIKFYFGNNKTWYGTSTAKIKTSRLDLTIKDLRPVERRSDSFFQFWNSEKLEDSFRWIDEPTNTFKFTVEHGKDEFSLSIFHPKYVFVEGDQEFTGRHNNENVYVKGTADGYKVDGRMKLKGDFGPDDQHAFIPGNVYFVSWENSHMLLQPELGYGRKIDLIKSKGKPIVTYTPSVSAGVFVGIQNATYSAYDKRYEYDEGKDEKMRVMGFSASVGNRIEIHNRKDTFGAFVEHKFTYGQKEYAFLDGEVKHDIKMNTLNFGVSAAIITFKKDKKPKKIDDEE